MKYYKFQDKDSLIGDGTVYAETEEGWSWREITVADGAYFGSNIKYPHWGLGLNDDRGDYENALEAESNPDDLQEITAEEFEQIWSVHLAQNEGRWRTTKLAFPTGTPVRGKLAAYYPQGIVVDFGDSALGAVTHADFRKIAGIGDFSVGKSLSAIVAGHDEKYQWLILENPKFDQ